MKFRIWAEKGSVEFEADHMYVKDGAIVADKGNHTVAAISVANVYSVTEVQS